MTAETRHVSPQEFREALTGVDFPASRDAIIKKARDRGGQNREIFHILRHIRDRVYRSVEEVDAEIDRVYESVGGLPSAGPASKKKSSGE